jgi:hypothetical protein
LNFAPNNFPGGRVCELKVWLFFSVFVYMVVKSPMPFPQVPFCTSEVGLVVSIPYLQTIILKALDLLTVATMHESSTLESLTFTIKLLKPGCAKTIFFSQTFQNDYFLFCEKGPLH